MLRAELEPLGFTVEWIDMKAAGRAGHIVARHPGKAGAKRLLLIGHLDTVFEPDSPFQNWTRKGNDGEGPGAGDDKGGMAVMIAALRAMKAAGTLKDANIEIVLTGDEEDSGNPIEIAPARPHRRRQARRRGARFRGAGHRRRQGHGLDRPAQLGQLDGHRQARTAAIRAASSRPASGFGAIYELVRILDAFRRELREDKLTYNVGLIGGGATAQLDEGGSA